MRSESRGFTLIELMIVVVIIGILVGIAIPNFTNMKDRSREANVATNMHILRLGMEEFSVLHDGFYPVAADKAELKTLCPGANWPRNPFTGAALADADVKFDADPASPGQLGANPATTTGYVIKGYGKSAQLRVTLASG